VPIVELANTAIYNNASARGDAYHPARAGARRSSMTPAACETARVSDLLLHRVSAGDNEAVRECIARFGGLVWSLARRAGVPESDIEESVQEIFAELWRSGSRYDPAIASETAFIATIARRRLIDRRRRSGRRPQTQAIGEEPTIAAPPEPRQDLGEEASRAAKALASLSPEQQRVLRLSVYEGLSHELISRATGLPLGTVKTHARRGLMRLRELLGVSAPGGEGAA
jgi:RNA polymerase sigma-70 factor (ECF subfamily)